MYESNFMYLYQGELTNQLVMDFYNYQSKINKEREEKEKCQKKLNTN